MSLLELIKEIDAYPTEGIVFAQRIDGSFHASSEAIVLELSEDELRLRTEEVARSRCPGKSYFLEVSIVLEWLSDLGSSQPGVVIDYNQACERIISYAENDA